MFSIDDMRSFQGIQALGIMQALKTGDPAIDTLIAMILPFVMTKLLNVLTKNGKYLSYAYWFPQKKQKSKEYTRTISHRTKETQQGATVNCDEDTYNLFLIRAIKLYMHHTCQRELQDADLELTDVKSMIVSDDDDTTGGHNISRRHRRSGAGATQGTTSTAGMLRDCAIIASQVKDQWQEAGEYDGKKVFIRFSDSSSGSSGNGGGDESNGGNATADASCGGSSGSSGQRSKSNNNDGSSRSLQIRLKSNGPKAIDTFVGAAYKWYMDELKKAEKNDRFLFDFRSIDANRNRMPTFAKFKLGDNKTFDSLFSKECHSLLKTLNQFETKTGKYAVQGYPYKLGLLLHGPPGTGKTSLIKAMAHYTNRHIVTIPLSRISTNQDLTSLFFNGTYSVAGSSKVAKLGFSNVIFVLEDVDAGSKVVMSRELRRQEEERREEERRQAFAMLNDQPTGSQGPPPLSSIMPTGPTSLPPVRVSSMKPGGLSTVRMEGDDELDLTGILNVLDGVVDTPGRIVVMTTNHPEMLDAALIRPGRIDKVMELGYMVDVDVIEMLEHYYQTKLSKAERKRVKMAVNHKRDEEAESLKLIPARVEQLTMEKDCVNDMIGWLEEEAGVAGSADCSATDSDTLSSSENPAEEEQQGETKDAMGDPLAQHLAPCFPRNPSYIEEADDYYGDY